MKYQWSPPIIAPGDVRAFKDHGNRIRTGECIRVETRYRNDGRAMHNYAMLIPGRRRALNVGGDSICQQPPNA